MTADKTKSSEKETTEKSEDRKKREITENVQKETLDSKSVEDTKKSEAERAEKTNAKLNKLEIVDGSKDKELELEKAVDAINYAADGGIAIGTDKETIYASLKDKNESERRVMNDLYVKKFGISLEDEMRDEMEGSDLDKALNLLNRKDGDANDAGRANTAILELNEFSPINGRSANNIEKDLRDTVATMNSTQTEELDKQYSDKYGKSFSETISADINVSAETKQAISIYMKGSDKRSAEDNLELTSLSLKSQNVEMFNEIMASSTPESRKAFLDNDGKAKLSIAFTGKDYEHALSYAETGKQNTASKIRDNTGPIDDNEEAIELAIKNMSPEERRLYQQGKSLQTENKISDLSAEEKEKSVSTYLSLQTAMKNAGNDWEIAKWEEQIVIPGGGLATKLSLHRGSIYDDSTHVVFNDIENLTKEDFERAKTDPSYRKQIDQVLQSYLSTAEYSKASKLLDEKLTKDTFEEAQKTGNRTLLEKLKDNNGTFNTDEDGIISSIETMTIEEQKRYKEDASYKKEIDTYLKTALEEGSELDSATALLQKISDGKEPKQDIIDKLNIHASNVDTDEAAVMRDLQKTFNDNPELREVINNPKNEAERDFANRFNVAIHRALDASEYTTYAEPLIKTGFVSLETQVKLNVGWFDDSEQDMYKDTLALATNKSPEALAEREKLLTDTTYQEKVLGNFSQEERQVAMFALKQGEMKPEDKIRSYMLGAGTDESEIKSVLKELSDEQIETLKKSYAEKYGSDLSADLLSELGGQDARDAKRELYAPKNNRDAYNETRDEVYESNDGIGKWWVNNAWDGTGYMTQDALNQYQASMTKASSQFKELPIEEQEVLLTKVRENLDAFVQSKGAAADIVVDAVIIAAAVAACKFTGGVSLSLITKTALAGALFKTMTKSTIMGADYDWTSTQPVADALTGAFDATSIVIGPAQLAQALKIGEKTAVSATQKLMAEGAEQLFRSTTQETRDQFGKKMIEVVASAISNGAEGVDDKVLANVAKQFAKEGQEDVLFQSMKQTLQQSMETESGTVLKKLATESGLNISAGGIGGASSGGVRGALDWDSSKSVSENLSKVFTQIVIGGIAGGGIAGATTVLMKGVTYSVSKGMNSLRETVEAPISLRTNIVTSDGKVAFVRSIDNPHVEAIQRQDGSIVKLNIGDEIEIKTGDKPVYRLDKEGNSIDINGKRITDIDLEGKPGLAGSDSVYVNGQEFPINEGSFVFGRSNLNALDAKNEYFLRAGRDHLRVQRDEVGNLTLTDISQNGTWVNGTKVEPGKPFKLAPYDEVRLGDSQGPKVLISEVYIDKIKINNHSTDLMEQPIIGRSQFDLNVRDRDGISSQHVKITRDNEGYLTLEDTSTNGTWVNGKRLEKNQPVRISTTDTINLAKPDGPRLDLASIDNQPIKFKPLPYVQTKPSAENLRASNNYAETHIVEGKIDDGFMNAGQNAVFNADGSISKLSRPATVVDRENDYVLKATLAEGKKLFADLPPMERMKAITLWAKEKFTPSNMTGSQLDTWYDSFSLQNGGKRVYLGEMLRMGRGVCSQQALLVKLMADEFPDLKVNMVRGYFGLGDPTNLNHAWNEMVQPNGERLIFDPRMKRIGDAYKVNDTYLYNPGYDVYPANGARVGKNVYYRGSSQWKVEKIENGIATISTPGFVTASQEELQLLNPGRKLELNSYYRSKNADGTIGELWQISAKTKDGTFVLTKQNAITREVEVEKLETIQEESQREYLNFPAITNYDKAA